MKSLGLTIVLVLVLLGTAVSVAQDGVADDSRTALREEFLRWRFGMFLHFNMATYIDREWANGYEDPALFKPEKLDCGQWLDLEGERQAVDLEGLRAIHGAKTGALIQASWGRGEAG